MNASNQAWVHPVARILLGALFFISGISKLLAFAGTVGYMTKFGVPMPEVLAALTIAVEIGASFLLIIGFKARIAALVLAIFVAIITPIFHGYWDVDPAQYGNQFNHFWKNITIIGGMLYVFAIGAGAFSVDARRQAGSGRANTSLA